MTKKNKALTVPKLEAQFKQVSNKMQEAADALREANKLSEKFGFGSLGDGYDRTCPMPEAIDDLEEDRLNDLFFGMDSPLINAMDECGWQTSSLSC